MNCYLDQARRELVGSQGRKQLTPLEYRILHRLIQDEGQTVSKDELIEFAYPEEVLYLGVTDESLAQIISRLRRKLNLLMPYGSRMLKNVHGVGYTLKTTAAATAPEL
ncbi:MAG: winged helix-turn-helix domain-containing protein [Caldilineaceae bacterium]